jgi:hypothetical protein
VMGWEVESNVVLVNFIYTSRVGLPPNLLSN